MDYFKNFFKFSNSERDNFDNFNQYPNPDDYFKGWKESSFYFNHETPEKHESFNIFSGDPLELHRQFQKEMDNVLKMFSFAFFGNDSTLEYFDHPSGDNNESFDSYDSNSDNLRDHFLKSGYQQPKSAKEENVDKDIDNIASLDNFDSLFDHQKHNYKIIDRNKENTPFPHGTFFSQSIQVKTVIGPDGEVETRKTVRDSQGNEEVTISKNYGDKEYIIKVKKDDDADAVASDNNWKTDEGDRLTSSSSNAVDKLETIRSFINRIFPKKND